tara:strand:- start:92 stop:676 length:585 start_codon:yes stop_codon:yes gene_type:complete
VKIEFSNGDKWFYEGDSEDERLVKIEFSNGDKWFYEREYGSEKLVRIESSNGDKWFYEGEYESGRLVRQEFSNGDKNFYEGDLESERLVLIEYSNVRNISKKNPVKKQNYKKEINTSNTKIYSIKEKRSRLKNNFLKHRRNNKKIIVTLIEKTSIERLFIVLIFLTFVLLAIFIVYIQLKKPSTIIMTEPTIQP